MTTPILKKKETVSYMVIRRHCLITVRLTRKSVMKLCVKAILARNCVKQSQLTCKGTTTSVHHMIVIQKHVQKELNMIE